MPLSELIAMENFLRKKYGLPAGKPNLQELRLIVRELVNVPESDRTEIVWSKVVKKYVKNNNEIPLFEGLDMSDITLLQQQIMLLMKGQKGR